MFTFTLECRQFYRQQVLHVDPQQDKCKKALVAECELQKLQKFVHSVEKEGEI
jgi:hypothetical protein